MAMQQVTDQIWVGSMIALSGVKTLQRNNVTHVLSVMDVRAIGQNLERFKDQIMKNFKHMQLDIHDVEEEDIMQYFPTTNAFIAEAINSGGGILVHCIAGISRSVTVTCAYLMKENKWNSEEAIEFVKSKRPIANPNPSFREQLQAYYLSGYEVSPDKKAYREWKLKHQSQEFGYQGVTAGAVIYTDVQSAPMTITWRHVVPSITGSPAETAKVARVLVDGHPHALTEPVRDAFQEGQKDVKVSLVIRGQDEVVDVPYEKFSQLVEQLSTQQVQLRCKDCSSVIATSSSFVAHPSGTGTCQHHFTEPIEWMRGELEKGDTEGKLACPKCTYKLGSYQWQGSQCSCGTWVTPSFKIQKSRVDQMVRKTKASL